jgi:hypothetical protein
MIILLKTILLNYAFKEGVLCRSNYLILFDTNFTNY